MPAIILWICLFLAGQTAGAQTTAGTAAMAGAPTTVSTAAVAGAQTAAVGMKWMTLAEAEAAVQKEPRPILIDLYTDWCGWCKVMDKKTYRNKKVYDYLNGKFYAVKLDAESKTKLTWKGRTYLFNPQYKVNEIALFLSGGQLSYPTTVIIPAGTNDPQPVPGFLEPKELEPLVKYFGEGVYTSSPFAAYQRSFKGNW